MKCKPTAISRFARNVLGRPLYPYQSTIAEAILASILNQQGRIFTVMLARQSGKNQLSAVLEAFLLNYMRQGTIVKAAPTFNPQIVNSSLRLLSLLDTPCTRDRVWQSQGHIIGLAPQAHPALLRNHAGPRIMFFSAGPDSNVVGATADLLLEIDEAQDVAHEKFDRDFRPMARPAMRRRSSTVPPGPIRRCWHNNAPLIWTWLCGQVSNNTLSTIGVLWRLSIPRIALLSKRRSLVSARITLRSRHSISCDPSVALATS